MMNVIKHRHETGQQRLSLDEWMDGWVDGWMDDWMDGLMGGWADGLMGGWITVNYKTLILEDLE